MSTETLIANLFTATNSRPIALSFCADPQPLGFIAKRWMTLCDRLRNPFKVTSQSQSKVPVVPAQKYHPIRGKVTASPMVVERWLGARRRVAGFLG